MKRSIAVTLTASLAALALGGALVLRARPLSTRGPAQGAPQASSASRAQLAWKKGEAYVYRFAWENETAVRSPAQGTDGNEQLRGVAQIDGELELRCYGMRSDVVLFGARVTSLGRHRLELLGKDALGDAGRAHDAFDGREAFVEIDERGGVRAVSFTRDSPEIFRHTMRALLTQLHVTLSADPAPVWSADEPGPSGRAHVAWAETGRTTFVRTRAAYETFASLPPTREAHQDDVESRSTLEIAPAGYVQSLHDDETVAVRAKSGAALLKERATFALDFLRADRFEARDVDTSTLVAWHPEDKTEPVVDDETQRLTRLAEGMSLSRIRSEMFMVGIDQRVTPDFVVRGMALLQLHPELTDDVLRAATDRHMPPRGRELAADLLAATGHDKAQAALRALVQAVRGDETQYRHILQRVAFVRAPTRETVQMARTLYASTKSDAPTHMAAAYTLGSTAANLAARGELTEASAIATSLTRDLEEAKSTSDRRGLISALGNTGFASALPALQAAAGDDDPSVRADVAHAMRNIETPEARDALCGMAADASGDVARSALDSLVQQPLGESDVQRIAELTARGAIPNDANAALLTLLSHHVSPAIEPALRALAARVPGDASIQGRIDALLAQLHPEG